MNQPFQGNAVAPQYRGLEMKSPGAHHMQRDLESQSANFDSRTSRTTPATNRSTATAAQLERILEALRAGPKTTDALRALGVYQVSARIFGLRALGYSIKTDLFNGYAADGYSHTRMARYTLEEPVDVEVDDERRAAVEKSIPEDIQDVEKGQCAFTQTGSAP